MAKKMYEVYAMVENEKIKLGEFEYHAKFDCRTPHFEIEQFVDGKQVNLTGFVSLGSNNYAKWEVYTINCEAYYYFTDFKSKAINEATGKMDYFFYNENELVLLPMMYYEVEENFKRMFLENGTLKIKKGMVIEDNNGYEYEVLETKTSYNILKGVENGDMVVVWDLKKYDNSYLWGQGYHFGTLEEVEKYLDENLDKK